MRILSSELEIIEDNIMNQEIRPKFMYNLMSINQIHELCFFDSSII